MIEERYMHDPVPKNVSKFPIHQTYLTSDAERTSNGGYKFKCPDVWSSARSGKKSIAFRSIAWDSNDIEIGFRIRVRRISQSNPASYTNPYNVNVHGFAPGNASIKDILNYVINALNAQINDPELERPINIGVEYKNNTLQFGLALTNFAETGYDYRIGIQNVRSTHPPQPLVVGEECILDHSFERIFNQPETTYTEFAELLTFKNVWDRRTLFFHASFIPFDNYQYLGTINDCWNNPIVYQDPNTSPLFNIWTTTDLKNKFSVLHENFIIRFTFILDVEHSYES